MTTHLMHADILNAGLCPGCPRCEELAAAPTMAALDEPNRERLLAGVLLTPLDATALWNLQAALEGTD